MLEKTLLDQLDSLSPSQRLELIGRMWDLLDAEGLPLGDADTVVLEVPIGDSAARSA